MITFCRGRYAKKNSIKIIAKAAPILCVVLLTRYKNRFSKEKIQVQYSDVLLSYRHLLFHNLMLFFSIVDETNAPSVTKCFTSIFEQGGKGKQTHESKCTDVKDFYGNFQPQQIRYDVTADFRVDINNVTNKPFIKETKFGVTDFTIYVSKELITGKFI